MDMIVQLRETVEVEGKELETENLRAHHHRGDLSPKTLLDILKGSNALAGGAPVRLPQRACRRCSSASRASTSSRRSRFCPRSPEGHIRELLTRIPAARRARLRSARSARQFATADVELGLELVRLLVSMRHGRGARSDCDGREQPASAGAHRGARSHRRRERNVRVRTEMRKLLDDDQLEVRLAALQRDGEAPDRRGRTVPGAAHPGQGFLKLPLEGAQQSLQTLAQLRPKRCEEVCITLLKTSKLLQPSSLETTRELAARFLAEVASTDTAVSPARASRAQQAMAQQQGRARSRDVGTDASEPRVSKSSSARKSARDTKAADGGRRGGSTTMSKKTRKSQSGQDDRGQARPARAPPRRKTNPGAPAESPDGGAKQDASKTAMRKKRPAETAAPEAADDDSDSGRDVIGGGGVVRHGQDRRSCRVSGRVQGDRLA